MKDLFFKIRIFDRKNKSWIFPEKQPQILLEMFGDNENYSEPYFLVGQDSSGNNLYEGDIISFYFKNSNGIYEMEEGEIFWSDIEQTFIVSRDLRIPFREVGLTIFNLNKIKNIESF